MPKKIPLPYTGIYSQVSWSRMWISWEAIILSTTEVFCTKCLFSDGLRTFIGIRPLGDGPNHETELCG